MLPTFFSKPRFYLISLSVITITLLFLMTPPLTLPTLNIISEVPTTDKCIALTFDDGPDPVYTPMILDLLRENHIKATFFLIGLHSEWYPGLVKRINAEGHEIGNHSYKHKSYCHKPFKYVRDDVQMTNRLLTSLTGVRPKLLRPPFGKYDEQTIEIANQEHLSVVYWSLNSMDWRRPPASVMERQVVQRLKPGQIILFHDGGGNRKETVNAVAELIKKAKSEGYQFLTVSELINHRKKSEAVPKN